MKKIFEIFTKDRRLYSLIFYKYCIKMFGVRTNKAIKGFDRYFSWRFYIFGLCFSYSDFEYDKRKPKIKRICENCANKSKYTCPNSYYCYAKEDKPYFRLKR